MEMSIVVPLAGAGILFAVILVLAPHYRVYSEELRGKAILIEAESSRRVAVLEAEATRDAALALAAAEIERARGVAEANRIIGDSLKNNEAYLRYLYIDSLKQAPNQIIYVPTEAGLPILEAGRSLQPAQNGR
ncbi:membrane protease subunit [Pseudothauera rhizosphaerae]|uniref:Membrane protease subunit n=2 Tax=Pseudothauera rhizosphaerae TaxID=2565932 RepID=A0A4S4ALL3_9RHOO|nr:membrane protease subunit [Pseudothauera rhizosphaerae]